MVGKVTLVGLVEGTEFALSRSTGLQGSKEVLLGWKSGMKFFEDTDAKTWLYYWLIYPALLAIGNPTLIELPSNCGAMVF